MPLKISKVRSSSIQGFSPGVDDVRLGELLIDEIDGSVYLKKQGDEEEVIKIGSDDYSNSTPMPEAFGGLPAGTTFVNEDLTSVLDRLLYPYQTPQLTLTSNLATTNLEVGQPALVAPNALNFVYSSTNESNLASASLYLNGTQVSPLLDPGVSYTYPIADYAASPILLQAAGSVTWSVRGLDTLGNNVSSNNLVVNWRYRTFIGWSESVVADVAGLTPISDVLGKPSSASKPATDNGSYLYIFLPVSYGAYTRFKLNGLDVVMAPLETVTLSRLGVDVTYYVHRVFNQSLGAYLLEVG